MEINDRELIKFGNIFSGDYGPTLAGEELKSATGRLVRFFDLLARFDEEDRKKVFEMKEKQNGKRI